MFCNIKDYFDMLYKKTSSLEFNWKIVTNCIKLQPIIKNNNKKTLLHYLLYQKGY